MKNKKIKVTKEQIQYSDICPVCNRKIIGTSEGQVKYNMKIHCMQTHNLLIDIKPLPKSKSNKEMLKEIKEEVSK